ncbi:MULTISPECIES: class I adenylate-forming enzyme family protein [Cupriavidus]|uniref:class I adenylate-forming enzyme family protein n=1 Tax=Cupriavidus TaxID=106589 RepID=UPI0009F6615F|nr:MULTISPECIES: AMP-binding protein [Cupriavidus]
MSAAVSASAAAGGAGQAATLAEALQAQALAAPQRPALHHRGQTLSYGALWQRAQAVAASLARDWGIGHGDRVATLCLNHERQLALLFACARLGAILVPLNYRLAVPELQAVAQHAQLAVLFHDDMHAAQAREVAQGLCRHGPLGGLGEALPDPAAGGSGGPGGAVDGATPLLLAYTSGTTGQPKGALHTQAGMLANARASWWAHALQPQDHVLSVLPLFHVGGLCIQTLPALLAGAQVTLHDRFTPEGWLQALALQRPTLALMVPATLRAVLEHPDWPAADLSSLRGVMAGSSPIPLSYLEAFHRRGVPLGQVYGATETGPVSVALRLPQAMARAGAAGWPHAGAEVRLVTHAGGEAEPGEVGELWLRGDNLMQGYWREPAHPDFVDGWFRSGDLARRDADGCLTVVGRSKDMIISGGENIYPAEIENALLALPGVQECAVVGLPDPRWGEVPVAAIVPAPDADREALGGERLRAALDGRIARFKLPREAVLLDALPRSALGKVLKPQLLALLARPARPRG